MGVGITLSAVAVSAHGIRHSDDAKTVSSAPLPVEKWQQEDIILSPPMAVWEVEQEDQVPKFTGVHTASC